jgi:hypothetical protein
VRWGGWSIEAVDGEPEGAAGVGDGVRPGADAPDDRGAGLVIVWPSSAYERATSCEGAR